jgi:hypothetical protein
LGLTGLVVVVVVENVIECLGQICPSLKKQHKQNLKIL